MRGGFYLGILELIMPAFLCERALILNALWMQYCVHVHIDQVVEILRSSITFKIIIHRALATLTLLRARIASMASFSPKAPNSGRVSVNVCRQGK